MSQQLRLLPAPRPLTDRLGASFFRGIPRASGVYRMFDETGRLLYVGQSANLHERLGTQKLCAVRGFWRSARTGPTGSPAAYATCTTANGCGNSGASSLPCTAAAS